MQDILLKLAAYCPSCGEPASFTPIGDQEDAQGGTVALGNCSECGSTVALSSVESALRAAWPDDQPRCRDWSATVRGCVGGTYICTITVHADRVRELGQCVSEAVRELQRLGAR